jgi:hypothetical protein
MTQRYSRYLLAGPRRATQRRGFCLALSLLFSIHEIAMDFAGGKLRSLCVHV